LARTRNHLDNIEEGIIYVDDFVHDIVKDQVCRDHHDPDECEIRRHKSMDQARLEGFHQAMLLTARAEHCPHYNYDQKRWSLVLARAHC
jgi:hypothetical protein